MVLAALLGIVLWRTVSGTRGRDTISYGKLRTECLAAGRVQSIRVIGDRLEATLKPSGAEEAPERKLVYLGTMQMTPELVESWIERGINVEFRPSSSAWRTALNALPYIAILFVIYLLVRQVQSGQRGIFSFGKSRARELTEDAPTITFAEVAGVEEAKQELQEIVEFLKEPDKFQRLGGRIPRGVLMVGPPGTGKTYLARAVAGEAGVPFFSISGSDFVEMFVGVGASRVRDLFGRAKAKAPCIVFIDEIDAVGRHRGAGIGGGHDEREQTLNQLLVEMDGFNTSSTVILIAATNRPDVLDPALLRPGRFDRQVVIDMPDVRGRDGILKIHSKNVPLAKDVDLREVARGTPGLSGADLRNLVNEAALLAARNGRREVGMHEFEAAKEKVMWGAERRSLVMTEEDRRVTAVHEAGHALATLLTPGADPVHKITIVPRGRSLGLTSYLPDDERHTVSRSWCVGKLTGALGGRAAEELVIGEITNGAASDLEIVTALARRMVCEWGMSPQLGPVMVSGKDGEVFIGKDLVQTRVLSEQTLQVIDAEVRRFIDEALQQAHRLLQGNRDALDALAKELLVREVLDRGQIERIIRPYIGTAPAAEDLEPIEEVLRGPIIVEHPATTPRRRPERRDRSDEPPRKRTPKPTRRQKAEELKVEEPKAEELREQHTVVLRDETSLPPEPAADRKSDRGGESERVSPPRTPVTFGRKLKTVKRFGLPASEAPQSGIPVSSVLREDVIAYGRPLRPADDDEGHAGHGSQTPDGAGKPSNEQVALADGNHSSGASTAGSREGTAGEQAHLSDGVTIEAAGSGIPSAHATPDDQAHDPSAERGKTETDQQPAQETAFRTAEAPAPSGERENSAKDA